MQICYVYTMLPLHYTILYNTIQYYAMLYIPGDLLHRRQQHAEREALQPPVLGAH
jgi:hypothetical protein